MLTSDTDDGSPASRGRKDEVAGERVCDGDRSALASTAIFLLASHALLRTETSYGRYGYVPAACRTVAFNIAIHV